MAKRRRKQAREQDDSRDDRSDERDEWRPPRRRLFNRRSLLVVIVLVIVGCVVLAPNIVATPLVGDAVIAQLTADLPVRLDCGSLSTSWWSSIQLRDLQVYDLNDRTIASASAIETEQTLLQLALNPQALGTIRIKAPTVSCRVRAGGSDIEDLLAQLPQSEQEPTTVEGRIVIEQATIQIIDEQQDVEHIIDSLNAELTLAESRSIAFQTDGILKSDEQQGRFNASGELALDEDSEAPITLKLQCEQLPLTVLDAVSRRMGIDLSVSGHATGQVEIDVASAAETMVGELQVADLELYSAMIPDEYFSTQQAALKLDVIRSSGLIDLRQMSLDTDLGDAALTGKFDLSTGAPWQATVRQSQYQCQGQLDVAQLARTMPRTLRLRDGIQVTDGLVQWDVSNQVDGDAYRFAGKLETEGIRATKAGDQVDLTRPINMEIQLRHSQESFEVVQLKGRSTFAAFSGRGDVDRGQLALRVDLGRLHQELQQFIDLRDIELAGEFESQVRWQAGSNAAILVTDGVLNGKGLRASFGARQWNEAQLDLKFQGQIDSGGSETHLATGSVELLAGEDRLTAKITQPVGLNSMTWPLSVQIRGDLANWRDRLQMIGLAELPRVTGAFDATADVTASRDSAQFSNAKLNVKQLDLLLDDRRIQEPTIRVEYQGGWDGKSNKVYASDATLATTTFSIRAEQLEVPLQSPLQQARGQLNYRGDLARLWQWSQPRGAALARRPTGQLVGTLRIAQSQDGVRFATNNDIRDLVWMELRTVDDNPTLQRPAARRWTSVWREAKIKLLADGTVTNQGRDVGFRNLQAESDSAGFQLAGTVADVMGQIRVQLRGRTRMDFDRLTPRLQPIWGDELRLEGTVEKPLVVEGAIRDGKSNLNLKTVSISSRESDDWFPKDLNAQGAIGWDRAYAFGFDIGQATLDAQLDKRVLHIQPTALPVSGGNIRLAPRLQLRSPLRLTLAPGRVVDQVAITPQMCHGWLKYVAPLLADVTQAQGKFSVDLQSANIPLTVPDRARFDGTLLIHDAKVGPGPTTQQLLTVIQQIKSIARPGSGRVMDDTWIHVPEQNVTYRMANRRITHDQMTMIIAGVSVRTQGWVALNQNMSLVAEIPIQEDWVKSNRWLASLKGQTLRIPIRGTLQNPQLNQNVLQNLSRGALQDAAGGYLQNEVQRQLNRLLER